MLQHSKRMGLITEANSAPREVRTGIPMQAVVAAGLLFILAVGQGKAGEIPDGFVWLRDVDPTIEQDIRYYGSYNITGLERVDQDETGATIRMRAMRRGRTGGRA